MKTGKTLAFATAVLTAFIPLSSAGITAYDVPAVSAEEQAAAVNLPEWVPSNFKEALEFRNRFGATYIEDGFLCVLFTERNSHSEEDEDQYSVIEGTMVEDGSGMKEEHGLVTMELYHHTFTSDELDLPSGPQFEVVVYKAKKAGEFNVRLFDKALENTDCIMPSYSFSVSDKLEITETDLHAWVPDCSTEFENYKNKYGEVGTYEGKYLTFCMESNAGTPYRWTDFGHNTDGGILGNYGSFDCSPVNTVPLEGGRINTINVYFPEVDGPATVSWKLAKTFGDEEVAETLSANCIITDDASAILLGNNVRIKFVDSETGDLLNFPNEKEPVMFFPTIGYKTEDGSYIYADLALGVDSNPYIWKTTHHKADLFDLDQIQQSSIPEGYTLTGNYREIKEYDNGALDYTFKVSRFVAGDITGDGKTSILDAVTLQNWLIGSEGTTLNNAGAADINGDGKINVLDLCCIKQILLNSNQSSDQKPTDPTPDENTDHFNAEYIRTYINTSDTDITFPGHVIIKSQKEFEAFLNKYGSSGISDETKKLFADAKAKYTDEWFSDNSLFIALLEEGSGSIKHVVTNVTNDEVTIERWSPMVQTADMAWWCILVEGDKSLTFSENTKLVLNTVQQLA